MVLLTKLQKCGKQLAEGQLLLTKYVSCTLMYELKEYQKEIMPKIVFRTSHGILGKKLIKFPVRWYFGQIFQML